MEHHQSSFDIQVTACNVIWKLSILIDSPAVISDTGLMMTLKKILTRSDMLKLLPSHY